MLYAAQQRLLLGRQEQIAVMRTRKAVVGGLASQQEALQADKADSPLPSTQIVLTLLGAEITDSLSTEGEPDCKTLLVHPAACLPCSQLGRQDAPVATRPGWGSL